MKPFTNTDLIRFNSFARRRGSKATYSLPKSFSISLFLGIVCSISVGIGIRLGMGIGTGIGIGIDISIGSTPPNFYTSRLPDPPLQCNKLA